MDLAEGEEAMAIAAIFNERRLQGRLNPRYLCEVDVAAELFVTGCFEVEVVDLPVVDDRHTGLFRVGGVDQHEFAHVEEPFDPALL
jgi:hypothetical protein